MFRIGEFSRLARVSARQLRFYEEIGLFVPAHADPQTGYRSYKAAQLPELARIIALKELGFSLEQIRDLLRASAGTAELRSMLLAKRKEVVETLEAEKQRLRHIETRIAQIESFGDVGVDDVVIRAEPARPFLSLRRTVPSFQAARAMIGELASHARRVLPAGSPRQLVAVAHSPHFEPGELDVEFGYALGEAGTSDHPVLRLRELEAVAAMAACVRIGLPEDAHLVTGRIARFLEAGGYEIAGPGREVFLQPPNPERMHESIVEMQFPVRRAGATG